MRHLKSDAQEFSAKLRVAEEPCEAAQMAGQVMQTDRELSRGIYDGVTARGEEYFIKLRHTKIAKATPAVDTSACEGGGGCTCESTRWVNGAFPGPQIIKYTLYHRYLLPYFLVFSRLFAPPRGGPTPQGWT